MKNKLLRAIAGLFLISLILYAAGKAIFAMMPEKYFSIFPYAIIILFIINAGFFIYFFSTSDKTDMQFVRAIMGSSVVKILIYLTFIAIYIFNNTEYAVPFAISIIAMYFVFTAYDLYIMLGEMKRNREEKKEPSNHFIN